MHTQSVSAHIRSVLTFAHTRKYTEYDDTGWLAVHIKFVSHFNISASFCRLFYLFLFLLFCTLSQSTIRYLLYAVLLFVVAVIWLCILHLLLLTLLVLSFISSFYFSFLRATMIIDERWAWETFCSREFVAQSCLAIAKISKATIERINMKNV